jgi:hypothetical protein
MTNKGKKLEPPLKLDMSFGEALDRLAGTDPKEVDESMRRAKTKKPHERVENPPDRRNDPGKH